jgi:hypothetical protein
MADCFNNAVADLHARSRGIKGGFDPSGAPTTSQGRRNAAEVAKQRGNFSRIAAIVSTLATTSKP